MKSFFVDSPNSSVRTPSKDGSKCMPTDNLINHTPTRRSHAKPTSLFSDFEELVRGTKSSKKTPATECNLQMIECTERLDYEPVCTTETDGKAPLFTPQIEIISKSSSTTAVHHTSRITDIAGVTSKEPVKLVQEQNDISNTTTLLDQGSIETGAISNLLDSRSHMENPALDKVEESSAELNIIATDDHDMKDESPETKLVDVKESEALDVIGESDEILQDTGRSFEETIPLAFVNGKEKNATIFLATEVVLANEAAVLLPQESSKETADNPEFGLGCSVSGSTYIAGKERNIADVNKADIEEGEDSVMKNELSATSAEFVGHKEDIDPQHRDGECDDYSESDRDYSLKDGTAVCDMIDIRLYEDGERASKKVKIVGGTNLIDDSLLYYKSAPSNEERICAAEEVIESSVVEQIEEPTEDGGEQVLGTDPSQDLTDDEINIGSIHDSDEGSSSQLQTNVALTSELTYQVLDEAIDKVLVDLTKTLPGLSLKEMMAIYRKVKNSEGLLYSAIEKRVEEGSS